MVDIPSNPASLAALRDDNFHNAGLNFGPPIAQANSGSELAGQAFVVCAAKPKPAPLAIRLKDMLFKIFTRFKTQDRQEVPTPLASQNSRGSQIAIAIPAPKYDAVAEPTNDQTASQTIQTVLPVAEVVGAYGNVVN